MQAGGFNLIIAQRSAEGFLLLLVLLSIQDNTAIPFPPWMSVFCLSLGRSPCQFHLFKVSLKGFSQDYFRLSLFPFCLEDSILSPSWDSFFAPTLYMNIILTTFIWIFISKEISRRDVSLQILFCNEFIFTLSFNF